MKTKREEEGRGHYFKLRLVKLEQSGETIAIHYRRFRWIAWNNYYFLCVICSCPAPLNHNCYEIRTVFYHEAAVYLQQGLVRANFASTSPVTSSAVKIGLRRTRNG